MTTQSAVISVTITRPFEDVYAFLADWSNLSQWASGVGAMGGQISAQEWKILPLTGGSAVLRVAPRNEYGVFDHTVCLEGGVEVYVPMRAVRNGDGTDVAITLFRSKDMSDAHFEGDRAHIQQDLVTLRRRLES